MMKSVAAYGILTLLTFTTVSGEDIYPGLKSGKFKWSCSAPLIEPKTRTDDE